MMSLIFLKEIFNYTTNTRKWVVLLANQLPTKRYKFIILITTWQCKSLEKLFIRSGNHGGLSNLTSSCGDDGVEFKVYEGEEIDRDRSKALGKIIFNEC